MGSNPAGPTTFMLIYCMAKKTVLFLFGGQSFEHEISIKTAYNVVQALDDKLFNYLLVGISKKGFFYEIPFSTLENLAFHHKALDEESAELSVSFSQKKEGFFVNDRKVDVVFPLLHGTFGEDGAIQGFLKMFQVPFVGNDIKSSALCMDKDFTKKLLSFHGIPVVPSVTCFKNSIFEPEKIVQELGLPLFVKPAEQGSSVGVFKVKKQNDLQKSVEQAFTYGSKVLIEKGLTVRELEVAVLGFADSVKVSDVGEICVHHNHEFYSYDSKYMDPEGAKVFVNADITKSIRDNIKAYALKAFSVLECQGLARIDFFLTEDGCLYLNEMNTMPGFTNISMYPKLWMEQGLSYSNLISELIHLAFQQFQEKQSYYSH